MIKLFGRNLDFTFFGLTKNFMMPEFAQNYFVLVVLKNTKILNSKHLK